MSTINNSVTVETYINESSIAATSASGTNQPSSKLYAGDSVFSYGLDVLFLFMGVLSDQANSQYSNMEAQSSAARKAQEHASTVDGQIADLASGKTTTLNPEVKKYIEENKIEIDGVSSIESDGSFKWNSTDLTAGQLTAVKGALDSTANRATDFVSTAQLQLQKQMQTYNVCVSLINSMQSMLADMNKTIAQGIR
ncbi:secretion protein EspA [Salmonella enterica subsp. enterica]|nr:secretion protein EspA [Salmonella enterica subsp. enterica serovar Bonn]EBZ5939303.1 secretion protein EspA [Salmonella enterica subsp. enterica serovar Muenchen]MLZ41047.1 secretion protein EspA [Salmonella enterica subsp. enterica serovar Bonn]